MGGGGGNFDPSNTEAHPERLEAARQEEQEYLDGEVNEFLQELLKEYNDRDTEKTQERLDKIKCLVGEQIELEKMLLGGSVAKHTYIDGLSDIDSLVLLNREETRGLSAQKTIEKFHQMLSNYLPIKDVASIEKGQLAVTITYKDGTEIQLLPAVRKDGLVKIPDASGAGWRKTDPTAFQQKLTAQNQKLNNQLVPTIKLIKSLISDLPKQQRMSGYHIEALAVEVTKNYNGAQTPKHLLSHILGDFSSAVNIRIRDATGQSRHVDEYLGGDNSTQRLLVSDSIVGIKRKLDTITSITQWKSMFGKNR
jgi:hypothetical protein